MKPHAGTVVAMRTTYGTTAQPTTAQPTTDPARPPTQPTGIDVAVRTDRIVKRFGAVAAVDGIDLVVPRGQVFGILGPNGAGKTTLLRMLATLLPIDGGRAEVFGVHVARCPHQIRQLIGLTGQYASVDEVLTGRENPCLFGRLQGLSVRAAAATADELLAAFGLGTEDRRVAQYSGGMRRRLDLAASLITRPPLVFLDEPTTGLEPRTRGQMWDTIRGLVNTGCTVLLTTQYLDEADQLAARIALIDRGRLVAEGTPEELKNSVGSSTLQLTVADPARLGDAAEAVRRALGRDVVLSPERVRLGAPLATADESTAALVALRDAGIALASISVAKPTLDEVFLTLTGHDTTPDTTPDTTHEEEHR